LSSGEDHYYSVNVDHKPKGFMPSFPGFKLPGDHQLLHQHPDLLHLRQQVQDHLPAGVAAVKTCFFIVTDAKPK
jgi:hypothetical protein